MGTFEEILRKYTRKCADEDELVQYLIKKCVEEVPGLTKEQAREAICSFFESAVDFTLYNNEDSIDIITDSTSEFIFDLGDIEDETD